MVPATGGGLAKVRGRGECPRTGPQCNCSWTLGALSRPPCPLFRRENFLDAHHATVHRAILAPRGGPRKILRRHSRQAGTRWECSRVRGSLPRSPATPRQSSLVEGTSMRQPCSSQMPLSFIQQRQPQRSPCSEAEGVASQKTALPALWNSPLGWAVGSHFSGAPGTIVKKKRPPGGARQPARPGRIWTPTHHLSWVSLKQCTSAQHPGLAWCARDTVHGTPWTTGADLSLQRGT